jgi:heat shock protein HslJ
MKKNHYNWKWIGLLITLLLLFVACKRDEPTPTPEPEVQVEPTAAPATIVAPTSVPEAAEQEPVTDGEAYQDIPWFWVSFSDPAVGLEDIPEPERYQIVLNNDGSINVQSDCNMVSGSYTVEGGSITINLGPSTLVACPEDSLADQFVQNLTAAAIMFYDGPDMLFDLKFDSGTMRFSSSGSAAPATIVAPTSVPEAAEQEPVTDGEAYQDIPWFWVSFSDSAVGLEDIPEPERYQIVLNSDGSINVQADCNMVSGSYTVEAGIITINLGPSTLVACPEDSLADQFVQNLTAAAIMFFDDPDMLFDLKFDSGTMRFSSSGSAAPEISQPIYLWGEVADRLWVLLGQGDVLNPTVVEEGTSITAVFSSVDGQVNGSGGCTNYFTSYESTDDGGLTISGPIGTTMMFCEDTKDQEGAYFAALETVSAWSLTGEGRLELTYDSGAAFEEKLVYAPGETPLAGPIWRLVSYGDPEDPQALEEGTSITADFSPETDTTGNVGGSATCNSYSTSYTIDGDQISFGPIAGTLMMCPIGADQEQAYLAALGSTQTYQIVGPNLQITYDGGVLNYTSLNLPLENVLWQALVINGQPVPEEVEITILFTPGDEVGQGSVGGNAGCNSYNTSYETDGESLMIPSPMAMTMAMCPDEALAELELAYIGGLETAESYETLGEQLVIHSTGGDILYSADREPLMGTLWSLISLGGIDHPQPPVDGSNFTARFNRLPTLPSGTVVGETGCNDYNATFTANLNEIKINLPSKTNNEECPWGAGVFEVEQQFFLALNAASEYHILGNVLQIPYGEGETQQVLNFVATQPEGETAIDLSPLHNTFWYLSAIGDNPILPFTEITAGFKINDDGITGEVNGFGGCNVYNAAIGENFAVGPIISTQRGCQMVMGQEGGYFNWLSKAYDYNRAGDQLLVSTGNGVLTFNSEPSA